MHSTLQLPYYFSPFPPQPQHKEQTISGLRTPSIAQETAAVLTSNHLISFSWRQHPDYSAVQRQTAVTAYFSCDQLLLFVFELQDPLLPSSTGIHKQQ